MRCFCDKSLAQIVINDLGSAEVLEKYSLDFSCKGSKTLRQACMERSIKVEKVAAELKCARAEEGTSTGILPFEKLSLASLTDYIVHTHHDYLREQLPRMRRELEKIADAALEPATVIDRIREAFGRLELELMRHLGTEENILFNRVREIEFLASGCNPHPENAGPAMLQAPVALMLEQHEYSDGLMLDLMKECLDLIREFPQGWKLQKFHQSLRQLEADIHIHMHLENNILFPRALDLLEKMSANSPGPAKS